MAREKESKLERLFRFRTLREALCQLCMEKNGQELSLRVAPMYSHKGEREREGEKGEKRE